MCCGSGAVGAMVAAAVETAELHAADVDPACVRCARRNLPGAGVYEGDLYAALPASLRGRVDVLVANVPYVPTDEIGHMPPEARDHEPAVALDGGADGLDMVRRLAAGAPAWLSSGGHLLVETSERQAPSALQIMRGAGLVATVTTSDELYATVVIGQLS
jgi:release factor glutamine methyltransferase